MRAKKFILAVMAIGSSLWAMPQGAAEIASKLSAMPQYMADATFEVLLPQASDPVTYQVTLQSEAAPTDTLAPCSYIIRWQADTSSQPAEGFSAYFDGNHYRYRNHRLQEYHAEAAIAPFMPLGAGSQSSGVQSAAQFADLLPQFIGKRIEEMLQDSSYVFQLHPDTLIGRERRIVIDGAKRGRGYDVMLFSYVFDKDTLWPVSIEIENSPGSISEQIVDVKYSTSSKAQPIDISDESLMEQWPEVFEKYRESTFRSENLVGTRLPAIASQSLDTSERYIHNADDRFPNPVLLVALDPSVATTESMVQAIRDAVDMAPLQLDVLWVFNTNRTDEIKSAIGDLRFGETALVSANSLLRSCGITLYPTTILVESTGNVTDVVPGFNNETGLIVLQKAMSLK